MKKITALLLALVMLTAVLTGCAKDEAPMDTMSNGSWMDEAADAPAADMEWAEDDMAFDVTEDVMDSVSAHTSAGEAVKPETEFP